MNLPIRPYLIVPNLIPQPTWGGDYIAKLKGIDKLFLSIGQSAQRTNSQAQLGQSYELFSATKLSTKFSTKTSPTIEVGDANDPLHPKVIAANDQPFDINQLIATNPQSVLGSKIIKLHGNNIDILIKLTQAQENSYQLHVPNKVGDPRRSEAFGEGRPSRSVASREGRWLPKPESWYFLKPGLITLGVKPKINWQHYQQTCELVDEEARTTSQLITNDKLTLEAGRQRLQQFITAHNPRKFINRLSVPQNCAVDLSQGGIHHSWESDPNTIPSGNILYELQQNVFDPVSTIRAFDQGKIKPDGSIRALNIADYFQHIDRSPQANHPKAHFTSRQVLKHTSTYTIRQIFDTHYYRLQQVSFSKPISNLFTTTSDSYHHLFVRSGNIQLLFSNHHWTVTTGFSIFIPAAIGTYTLKTYHCRSATVLKTYL